MSAPARIVDKLRNYEYEKCGCKGVVGDIYALIQRIADLEEEIEDLQVEAREKNAWEGRYNALLEECEASRPREIDGGESSRGAAGKPSALDQAVAKVKGIDETSLILKGFPQEADLALLLESLSSLQVSIRKRAALAEIVLLCTTWADFLSTSDGSLDHVRECVESAPNRGGFTSMVNTAGDIASDIDDGLIASQKQHLLTIAQYALAWLAELIEKEEA